MFCTLQGWMSRPAGVPSVLRKAMSFTVGSVEVGVPLTPKPCQMPQVWQAKSFNTVSTLGIKFILCEQRFINPGTAFSTAV